MNIDKIEEMNIDEVMEMDSYLTESTISGMILMIFTLQRRVNQLIDEVERLERLHMPVVDLDNPEENCKVCDHTHELTCKCGCPAVPRRRI